MVVRRRSGLLLVVRFKRVRRKLSCVLLSWKNVRIFPTSKSQEFILVLVWTIFAQVSVDTGIDTIVYSIKY